MKAVTELLLRLLRRPLDDYLAALQTVEFRLRPVGSIAIGFALSWWIYVPIHELGHAFGCLLSGGEVTRLEIDPIYGAALLQRMFSFVVVGSDYAGQLSGFDTHGNDLIYLTTDLLPFFLTIFIGVPLLRLVGLAKRSIRCRNFLFGAALPVAYAPFIALTGDYYEIGSIFVSRTAAWISPDFTVERWRSDDLFRLIGDLTTTVGPVDVLGVAASLVLGTMLAFVTYGLGVLWARLILTSYV